jgi:eukaryotic-like serine/threonine-protein kinase
MAYCHECGSEVAQIDVYCPFCGIALQFPTEQSESVSPQVEAAREVVDAVASKSLGENTEISTPNASENAEDWEIKPVKQSEAPVRSFFQMDDDVDANAVTVVERTKKTIEPAEKTEDLAPAENLAKVEPIADKTESINLEEKSSEQIEVEDELIAEPIIDDSNNLEITENPVIGESISDSFIEPEIDSDISDNIESEIEEEKVDEQLKEEIAEAEENTPEPESVEEPLISDIDDRNFEEQFERIVERAKTGSLAETEQSVDEKQEQIVESIEPESETPTVADPFESTMAYTSAEVKDLNLAEKEAVAETENEPEIAENLGGKVASESSFEDLNAFIADENQLESPIINQTESEAKVIETESVLESAVPFTAAPIIAESIAKEEVKERYTSQVGEVVDTGGGKSKLKPLTEGTILNGRYEIVRKIGGGGMGAVYLASDRNLGGVLRAVKEMVQSHIEESQQDKAVNDFKRESLLLTSLEHPSIPTIYDYFFDERENRFYLVMKYISGGDLAGRLRSAPENRLDEKTITEWAIQVADVLDYLHSREPPIVYRDLKPSNVMIDGNSGRVMLIDFGIARWVSAKEEKGVTAVGTMGYAPPELFSGNVEPRSDIYSLGSTMFHLLTGADPQNSPLLIFDFSKNPRPRQINSMLSDQIEQILLHSVEYDADKRFANAAELREVLINHLENIRTGKLTFGVGDGISAVGFVSGQMVFCGFCGQKIVASDMFCPFCGARQATGQMSSSSPIPQSVYNVPSIVAKLHLIGTNDLDAVTYSLEKDNNLIGRRDPMSNIFPEVDLSKYDPQTKISRRHARLWREGDTFMVEDLGSSNGTVLLTAFNEQLRLLPHQPRVIAHGDKIKIGDTTLHFVVG